MSKSEKESKQNFLRFMEEIFRFDLEGIKNTMSPEEFEAMKRNGEEMFRIYKEENGLE